MCVSLPECQIWHLKFFGFVSLCFVFENPNYRPFISTIYSKLILFSAVTASASHSLPCQSSLAHEVAPSSVSLLLICTAFFPLLVDLLLFASWGEREGIGGGVFSSCFSHFSYFDLKRVAFPKQRQLISVSFLTCRKPISDCVWSTTLKSSILYSHIYLFWLLNGYYLTRNKNLV